MAIRSKALARVLATAGVVSSVAVVGMGPASAAQSNQTIQCGNTTLEIRTNNNNSSDHGGWSVGQVVDDTSGNHLIPVTFSGTATDTNNGQVVFQFDQAKGNGNGNHNLPTVTCTQTMTATWDELSGGAPPPPGVNPDDTIVFNFTVTAVPKG